MFMFVPVGLNMFKTIEGPADFEIRSVIRFLNARNVLPIEIDHQICQVYGDNAVSDGVACNSKQKSRNADCHHSFASRLRSVALCCSD